MDKKIQWHPGFVAAVNLELAENRNALIYEKEYNLNTKPLEIDLLVIKKDPGVRINNEIGKIFRGHNIMEYKSPEDHLNIDTFYKSGAYAMLYKAYGNTVDERKADDITVSIVRETKPEGLFEYFYNHGYRTANPYHGIYYVLDHVLFKTQIIVTKELDKDNHIWMKSLSRNLKEQDMKELIYRINCLKGKLDKELADSVLEVSVRANKEMMKDLRGEDIMCEALLEIMEPEIMEIRRRAKEEGQMEGRAEGESRSESRIILNMYKKGCPLELIAEVCGKSVEEVEQMVKKQYNK